MLSENQKRVQNFIETELSGLDKDDALLFHVSVERKIISVNIWFKLIEETIPDFIQQGTYSTNGKSLVDLESTSIRLSAFIDAFFMSGKSTLDAFAHEVRSLYGLGGHRGDLYFEKMLHLLLTHHSDSELSKYFNSLNITTLQWYKDLNSYRQASAHESIIQVKPSLDFDFLRPEWRNFLLKLPLNPLQRPLNYNEKNFMDCGKEIENNLYAVLTTGYEKILSDIKSSKTKIIDGPQY